MSGRFYTKVLEMSKISFFFMIFNENPPKSIGFACSSCRQSISRFLGGFLELSLTSPSVSDTEMDLVGAQNMLGGY